MSDTVFRPATHADVPGIVALLADDALGATRESPDQAAYLRAFEAIDADPRNALVVADRDGELVGTMQLTFIPGLSHNGAERLQIEAVRVRSDLRGQGLGREMITWALEQGRGRGCRTAQLTTHKSRVDAHRFYAGLGFAASHEGMKLVL
ncbi:GNAT family N-acetyltransferase [Phytohabitans rumicis]|uniref:GNAT family acetyltransferase n=1 Tax=Phytohabitans rumicis TaxID=1076125 RepID=A0A6V8L3L1_9ACTN|nr:GNAT family N-acetyltransferase [Phytohabitans rumicis]GFJ88726.1 GNAT family acetyltransferase [Phytohabitans rumicis]